MKKLLLLVSLLLIPLNLNAKETVALEKCVDGDTAWFKVNNTILKTRFLAIDTPESTNRIDPFGKEASAFTCDILSNAQTIYLEYDPKSDKTDKYDRTLAWVFADNNLVQEQIIENGLGKVAYLYGDYLYTDTLKEKEQLAKSNKLNIWQDYQETFEERLLTFIEQNPWIVILGVFLFIIILLLITPKKRKLVLNKVLKKSSKYFQNKK